MPITPALQISTPPHTPHLPYGESSPVTFRTPAHSPVEEQIIHSLENSVEIARDTLHIGQRTSAELDIQQEQIERMVGKVSAIDKQMEKSETTVEKMASLTGHGLWYRFKKALCCCTADTVDKGIRKHREQLHKEEEILRQDAVKSPPPVLVVTVPESDEDRLMRQLSSQLTELKENALHMNHQLVHHNTLLDVVNEGVVKSKQHARVVTRKEEKVT
ncbi:MAG: hypothetical protein V4534_05385 [Myxococcota bacterium]